MKIGPPLLKLECVKVGQEILTPCSNTGNTEIPLVVIIVPCVLMELYLSIGWHYC